MLLRWKAFEYKDKTENQLPRATLKKRSMEFLHYSRLIIQIQQNKIHQIQRLDQSGWFCQFI